MAVATLEIGTFIFLRKIAKTPKYCITEGVLTFFKINHSGDANHKAAIFFSDRKCVRWNSWTILRHRFNSAVNVVRVACTRDESMQANQPFESPLTFTHECSWHKQNFETYKTLRSCVEINARTVATGMIAVFFARVWSGRWLFWCLEWLLQF